MKPLQSTGGEAKETRKKNGYLKGVLFIELTLKKTALSQSRAANYDETRKNSYSKITR